MDTESIIGPLPEQVLMEMWCPDGFYKAHFYDKLTKTRTVDDPRLPPLPQYWEPVERERRQDDPFFFREFRNRNTGETVKSDPRMLPEALEQQGVVLERFRLV